MAQISCPKCNAIQKNPIKKWEYRPKINATQFLCKCGQKFVYYESIVSKKYWTIPKTVKK